MLEFLCIFKSKFKAFMCTGLFKVILLYLLADRKMKPKWDIGVPLSLENYRSGEG